MGRDVGQDVRVGGGVDKGRADAVGAQGGRLGGQVGKGLLRLALDAGEDGGEAAGGLGGALTRDVDEAEGRGGRLAEGGGEGVVA